MQSSFSYFSTSNQTWCAQQVWSLARYIIVVIIYSFYLQWFVNLDLEARFIRAVFTSGAAKGYLQVHTVALPIVGDGGNNSSGHYMNVNVARFSLFYVIDLSRLPPNATTEVVLIQWMRFEMITHVYSPNDFYAMLYGTSVHNYRFLRRWCVQQSVNERTCRIYRI